MRTLSIKSDAREEMIDITREVEASLPKDGDGICVLFVRHTTCGLTVNENADGLGDRMRLEADDLTFAARRPN